MPVYRYRAVAASGAMLVGDIEAADAASAIARLQSLGHYPIAAAEAASPLRHAWLRRDILAGRFRPRDLRLFTQQLATLLHAGVPLERALEILAGIAQRAPVRRLLDGMLADIRGGTSFADAAAQRGNVFPPVFQGMVRAGEAGGALDAVLARLAEFLESSHATRESIKSALVYPVLLLVLSAASVAVMLTMVLPQFRALFEDSGKPLPLVLAIGSGIAQYGLLAPAVLAAIILLVRARLRRPESRRSWHRQVLRLPLMGALVAKIELARFSRTLGTLLGNGVVLLTALGISAKTVGNLAIAAAIDEVAKHVREGRGLAEPLAATGVLPRLAVDLIRVGEESDGLKDMLLKIAQIYDEEVKRTIERLMALLVPALTITIGVMVAAIITSILTGILSVYDLAL